MAEEFFEDWGALIAAVDSKASLILKEDVAPVAEKILLKHIKSDIYDVYTPKTNGWVSTNGSRTTYQRRHVLENNVKTLVQDSHTILVTSTATASPAVVKGWSFHNRYPGAFLKLLESGDMGIWKGGFPRPAVKNAQNEINGSSQIRSAIKKGIKREIGICIEI